MTDESTSDTMNEVVIDTPIGRLRLVADATVLRAIEFADDAAPGTAPDRPARGILRDAAAQLEAYFSGVRTTFDLPLPSDIGTAFQRRAWAALCSIPYGATISYREQAERIGAPTAVRAVGAANGRNPLPIVVPCHRVVGADGTLTGYAGGTDRKRWLLDHERRRAAGSERGPGDGSGGVGSADAAVAT